MTRGGSTSFGTTATACAVGNSLSRCAAAWSTSTTPGSGCYSRRAGCTEGRTTGDPTLLASWDADRLALGRVGITPDPRRLCTDTGRELRGWADARAVSGHEPGVLASWGFEAKDAKPIDRPPRQ